MYRHGQPNWEFWMLIFQCGKSTILLPFWFFVRTILADFKGSKTAILTISKVLNSDYFGNLTLENDKHIHTFIILLLICSKWKHLGPNWFHVKSEWQKNPRISTLWIPNCAAQVCKSSNILASLTPRFNLVFPSHKVKCHLTMEEFLILLLKEMKLKKVMSFAKFDRFDVDVNSQQNNKHSLFMRKN